MRRDCSHLFPLIWTFLLFSTLSYGQQWSGVLATSRAIDWGSAGLPATLPDGETTTNPWTPPTRPACTTAQAGTTVPIPSGASQSIIASALAACASANPNGSYLLLGSGNFSLNSGNWLIYNLNNVTLRGSGPMSTTVNISSGSSIGIGAAGGTNTGAVSGSPEAGTTSVTLTGASGNPPAGLAWLNQCDTGSGVQPCSTSPSDNGSIFVCGDYSPCQEGSNSTSAYNHQYQEVYVTSVSGNCSSSCTVNFTPGLYMPNWSSSRGATLYWESNSTYNITGFGLEDLTINQVGGTNSQNWLVQIGHAYASWVKGVRFIGAGGNGALGIDGPSNSKNLLIVNNYVVADPTITSAYNSGVMFGTSSDSLLLNNITAVGMTLEGRGGAVGDVIAYNFGRDAFTDYSFNQWSYDHAAFSSFMLYEANQNGNMTEDDTWGTHGLNTYFRNLVFGYDTPYAGGTPNARGIAVANYHRFENLIGNAIGSSQITSYQGTGYNTAFEILTGDSLVASTLMRWGNVTNIQQSSDTPANSGIRFVSSEVPSSLSSPNTAWENPVPTSDNLPCSFYFSVGSSPCTPLNGGTGLSWWKVCTTWTTFPTSCATSQAQPFPPVGPELSSGPYVNGYAYDNPAAIAWKYLPIDTSLQHSYGIQSSSWSSGTETLTFNSGVLPNLTHLMGGFQLSGVNAACLPSSGVSYTGRPDGELLMTNSSSTTVSYALPNNPGTTCTGTMKFPDIRQFDERVYQNDASNGNQPNPPTGLSAIVN
jgi:hypothetical protein